MPCPILLVFFSGCLSVGSGFLGAPELLVHPICSTGITAFLLPHRILGCSWCCCDLCALRMRQWREQTLLSIVSNRIRGLIHLKMRPILEGKKPTKKKIKQKEAVLCFYWMLLLSPRKTHGNKFLFVYLLFLFIWAPKPNQQREVAEKMHDENTGLESSNHNLLWGCSSLTGSENFLPLPVL